MGFIPYGKQWVDQNDIDQVVEVLQSDWLTQGPKVEDFEQALCQYTGAKYAVAVSNGTAALHIAALAADIGKNDEVITSPITFVASANCAVYCGAKPVFADIKPDTINIDPEQIEQKITPNTKAIIPVHFAGHPCELDKIKAIASKHNLLVIEDAAHALGAQYKGAHIGDCSYSDMAVFSFHPVKQITTGEGGSVLTNDKDLYKKLLLYRSHGITKDRKAMSDYHGPWYYQMQKLGFNYRITDLQAALGMSQLKKLDEFIQRRKEIVGIYKKELSEFEGILLPVEKRDVRSAWHIYYIRLKDCKKRKVFFKQFRESGLGVQVHYIPVHLQPYYRETFHYKEGDYPVAEHYYKSTITIPLYPKMTDTEIRYTIDTIREKLHT